MHDLFQMGQTGFCCNIPTIYLDDSFVHEKSGHVFLIFNLKALALKKSIQCSIGFLKTFLLYRRDVAEMREKEKEARRLKEEQDKKMGEEMRLAAIQAINS